MKTLQYNCFRANFAKILKAYQSNSFGSFIAGKKKLVFRQETQNTKQTRLSLVFQWRFRISIYSAILLDWVNGIHWVLYNRSESIITIVSASRQIFLFDWKEVSTTQQSKIKSPDLSLSLSLWLKGSFNSPMENLWFRDQIGEDVFYWIPVFWFVNVVMFPVQICFKYNCWGNRVIISRSWV